VGRATDCHNRAAECLALAKQARDPAVEILFLEMSEFWSDLATTIAKHLEDDNEEHTFDSASEASRVAR
jgi:hypothetical protein